MSTTSPPIERELELFSLKIKQKPTSLLRSTDPGAADEMFESVAAEEETEKGYSANVDIFGKSDLEISGAVLDDGHHVAFITLATTGFTFDQLFSNFNAALNAAFVFDEVTVHLVQQPGEQFANVISFTGDLRMNSAVLAPFKNFFKLDDGLLLTASIDAGSQDLSNKIVPSAFTLASAAQLHLQVTNSIMLAAAALEVAIKRQTDAATGLLTWAFTPTVSGKIVFNNLGPAPVEMTAKVSYSAGTLHVGAAIQNISGLFGLSNVTLQELNVSFDAGSESSIDVAAIFSPGFGVFHFQGKITPQYAALMASAEDFSLDDLSDLFRSVSGSRLSLPDFDVTFNNVTIGLASAEAAMGSYTLEKGCTLGCSISVQGHTCAATAVISPEGILFEGDLGATTIGPVHINLAKLKLQFYSVASGKASAFAVFGSAVIEGVAVDCKVAYEKLGNTWNAVVYGSLSSTSFGLSNVFPAAAGTVLDTLKFSKAAFIFASQDSTTKDPDFQLPVKKGLQLTGILEEVPALSQLTRSRQVGLQLTALFGPTTNISIALPDTRLYLGGGVTTDPLSVAIQITPQPELDLIFGLNVKVPHQDTPLHFDIKLGAGIVGANGSGTMKGYWKDPFGVKGLQIGPELALQIDIIYAQFVSTGTPSGFGFVGGIMLGDVVGKMAVSIAEDPTKEILYGEILALSPQNLVKFASTITGLKLQESAIPDFFQLKQLKLYCAPTAGMIGTVAFEQGFSFAGNLVLFGKEVSVYASFNANGVVVKGHLDGLEIGPLKIKGEKGKNAELDLELTTAKQSVLIDGAIDFMGSHIGLFVDISKQGVEFRFDENFAGLLKYTVTGKSEGSVSNPSTMDFFLAAEFSNAISAYLKDTVSQKIKNALKVASTSIEALQQDLTKKEAAYKAVYDPANAALVKAQADADAALAKARQAVQTEEQKWTASVQDAQNKLNAAKLAYDTALANATRAVNDAQAKYNNAMKSAQDAVTNAQRTYDTAITNAQNKVNAAKANYDSSFGSAINNLNNYQNQVDSLQGKINDLHREIDRLAWYEKPKAIPLGLQIAGLETAKAGANGFLEVAKAIVNGFAKSSEAIAFTTAYAALQAVKTTGEFATLQAAQKVLQGIQQGVDYTAFKAAQQTLAGIQYSTQFTVWEGAQLTLKTAQTTGRALLTQAEAALANIGTSVAYTILDIARKSLDAIKKGTAAVAYQQAQLYLQAAQSGAGTILSISAYIAAHAGEFIDVRRVKLSARLKDIEKGKLFNANIDLSVMGIPYNWTMGFNVQEVESFIQTLFIKTAEEAKKIVGG